MTDEASVTVTYNFPLPPWVKEQLNRMEETIQQMATDASDFRTRLLADLAQLQADVPTIKDGVSRANDELKRLRGQAAQQALTADDLATLDAIVSGVHSTAQNLPSVPDASATVAATADTGGTGAAPVDTTGTATDQATETATQPTAPPATP